MRFTDKNQFDRMREARRHGDALMPVMNYCIRREDVYKRQRILKRNVPARHKMFVEKWIPLENLYFTCLLYTSRCV